MQTRDFLMIAVGLGLVAWLIFVRWGKFNAWLMGKWFGDFGIFLSVGPDNWRWLMIMSCLIVPAVSAVLNHYLIGHFYACFFISAIGYLPANAWLIYASWRSQCNRRWLRVLKIGFFVLFGLCFSAYLNQRLSNINDGMILYRGVAISTFGSVWILTQFFLLVLAARTLNRHLTRDKEQIEEKNGIRINFKFLLVLLAFLGALTSTSFGIEKVMLKFDIEVTRMYVLSSLVLPSILFTVEVVAIFFPNRLGDLLVTIPLLAMVLLGNSLQNYVRDRELAIMAGTPEEMASLTDYLLFVDYYWCILLRWVACFIPMRVLFHLAGLRFLNRRSETAVSCLEHEFGETIPNANPRMERESALNPYNSQM